VSRNRLKFYTFIINYKEPPLLRISTKQNESATGTANKIILMQENERKLIDTLRLTFILFTPNRKPRFAVSGFTFAVLANMKLRLTFFLRVQFFSVEKTNVTTNLLK
jgi:hypothetical protein